MKTLLSILFLTSNLCLNIFNNYFNSQNSRKVGFYALPTEYSYTNNQYITQIELDKAWDIAIGKESVVVGVADSGLYSTATDIINNVNTSLSHSFTPNQDWLYPAYYHGTAMASIIGASANNNAAAGVNWKTSLAILRIDDNTNPYDLENIDYLISAINYATSNNIPIMNFSGGFYLTNTFGANDPSLAKATASQINSLHHAISNYPGLLVCASGNEGNDFDNSNDYLVYPACFSDLNNIITVGGCNSNDTTNNSFNRSENYVDLLCPAINVYYSNQNNYMSYVSGTSAASALVCGVAALIKSVNPTLSTDGIKNILLTNCDKIAAFNQYSYLGRRLNAFKAVKAAISCYSTIGSEIQTTYQLSPGEFQWFEFNAPSAGYKFESTGELKTSGFLHINISNSCIDYNYGNDYENNFQFNHTFLEYGNTKCYVKLENIGTTTGYSNLKISLNHTHDYTYQYLPYNQIRHQARCYDGAYKLEEHVVQIEFGSTSGSCIKCGATVYFGFEYLFEMHDHTKGYYILRDGTVLINSKFFGNTVNE